MVSRTQALRTGLAGTGGSGSYGTGFFNNTLDDCHSAYDENMNEHFIGSQKLLKRRFSEKPKKVIHKAHELGQDYNQMPTLFNKLMQ